MIDIMINLGITFNFFTQMDDADAMMKMMGFSAFGSKVESFKKPAPKKQSSALEKPAPKQAPNQQLDKQPFVKDSEHQNGSASEDDIDVEDDVDYCLPIQCKAALYDHTKSVAALTLDPACSRLATAGRDFHIKLWDFNGMNSFMKPFHSFEPNEGNPIRDLQFGMNGSMFIAALNTAEVKLFDRNGDFLAEYDRGDPYLRDLRHTMGHTASVGTVKWHPLQKDIFMTAAADSTIRVWDVEETHKQRDCIVLKSKERGGKTVITTANYSKDGRLIAGGGFDGGIRIYQSSGPFTLPSLSIEKAHNFNTHITSLEFSINGQHLISRSMDDTVKLWDLRNLKVPVATQENLTTYFEESNVIYSLDETFILAGLSVKKGESKGSLIAMNSKSLEILETVEMPSSVIRLLYSPKIHQVFCGTGDGSIQICYNPSRSTAGILVPIDKSRRKLAVDEYEVVVGSVLDEAPDDTPEKSIDHRAEKVRRRAVAAEREKTRPENPYLAAVHGRQGRAGSNVTHKIIKDTINGIGVKDDPREVILKYAKESEENPYWVDSAYTGNPKVLASKVYETEEEVLRDSKKRRRK